MASSKELAAYVMDQLDGLSDIRSLPMMGGYLFYHRERIFGGIYGEGFLVKDCAASRAAMPDSQPTAPYPGAKPMLPVLILDDRKQLQAMVAAMYEELPEPKKKRKK